MNIYACVKTDCDEEVFYHFSQYRLITHNNNFPNYIFIDCNIFEEGSTKKISNIIMIHKQDLETWIEYDSFITMFFSLNKEKIQEMIRLKAKENTT